MAKRFHLVQLEANTLGNLGIVWEEQENYPRARHYHARAKRLALRIGDAIGHARHMYNTAVSYAFEGKESLARKWFLAAEHMAFVSGQDELVADCLFGRAKSLTRTGRGVEAETCLMESVRLFERTESKLYLSKCHEALGDMYLNRGLPRKASQCFHRARDLAQHRGTAAALQQLDAKLAGLAGRS